MVILAVLASRWPGGPVPAPMMAGVWTSAPRIRKARPNGPKVVDSPGPKS